MSAVLSLQLGCVCVLPQVFWGCFVACPHCQISKAPIGLIAWCEPSQAHSCAGDVLLVQLRFVQVAHVNSCVCGTSSVSPSLEAVGIGLMAPSRWFLGPRPPSSVSAGGTWVKQVAESSCSSGKAWCCRLGTPQKALQSLCYTPKRTREHKSDSSVWCCPLLAPTFWCSLYGWYIKCLILL